MFSGSSLEVELTLVTIEAKNSTAPADTKHLQLHSLSLATNLRLRRHLIWCWWDLPSLRSLMIWAFVDRCFPVSLEKYTNVQHLILPCHFLLLVGHVDLLRARQRNQYT
ncbi:hypothetical protein NE237_004773 [Protea cynaroides]|uniref:Uncharacterized protein n=1 Tax=Protea cynaroides TaxID=273540 RepID=A0A9Q0KJI9_9MAGN|nr:hypothetical protein NE237_004773 [Protea cynaroides]